MNITILYKDANRVRSMLSSEGSTTFFEWLDNWLKFETAKLKTTEDPIRIHRSQGAVEVLERLTGLKKELDSAIEKKLKETSNAQHV